MNPRPDTTSLENSATDAGSAWACLFSSSEEYESKLIAVRRAEGRYARRWHWVAPVAAGLSLIGAALLIVSP